MGTLQITIRYTESIPQSQTWYLNRDGEHIFTTTVYPPLSQDQLLDIDRLHHPQCVEGSGWTLKAGDESTD